MPVFAAVFLIMTMSSIGLPALNGFIGELLILLGVYVVSKWWAAVAAAGIVLGAAYMLWLYQRTMFGKITNPANASLSDLSLRELATFAPLAGARVLDWPVSGAISAADRNVRGPRRCARELRVRARPCAGRRLHDAAGRAVAAPEAGSRRVSVSPTRVTSVAKPEARRAAAPQPGVRR